jgi:mannose-6-phosphate isomerase-like protein (cupin superfamily)
MNRKFQPREYFTVPDGTEVSPFLNAMDVMQRDVPWGALGDMSIAAGRINPGVSSWIHFHPIVTQVTFVVSGTIRIQMKGRNAVEPYLIELQPGEASVCEPGTLFQLINSTANVAEVLYVVSPSYVFEKNDKVIYDDAVLVAKTWKELEAANYHAEAIKRAKQEAPLRRAESIARLERIKAGMDPEKAS